MLRRQRTLPLHRTRLTLKNFSLIFVSQFLILHIFLTLMVWFLYGVFSHRSHEINLSFVRRVLSQARGAAYQFSEKETFSTQRRSYSIFNKSTPSLVKHLKLTLAIIRYKIIIIVNIHQQCQNVFSYSVP